MIRTQRHLLALALVALGAGCDALIGLGDEPSGAASTSSSTGDASSSSTSTTSTTTSGDASSSSAGGGDAASASAAGGSGGAGTASSGAGGDGAGGSGGEGGGEPALLCGPCGDLGEGCHACDPSNTRCIRRTSAYDVWAEGTDIGSDVNRLGRGLAVTPAVVAFWALSDANTPSVFVLDRATRAWTILPFPRSDDGNKPFYSIGAVPGTGRVLVLDNGGGMLELRWNGNAWTLEPEDAYTLPDVGVFGGSLQGLHLVDVVGRSHKFDPTEGPASNPCRVSNDSIGSAPIDARVDLLGGEITALSIGYGGDDGGGGLLPIFVGRGGFGCATGDFAVTEVVDLQWGLAVAAFGDKIYAKGATEADGTGAIVVELSADGAPTDRRIPSNRSRALLFRPTSALVPQAVAGLNVCTEGTCTPDRDTEVLRDVKELVARPDGYISLGFEGDVSAGPGWGVAVVGCVDES